jgi:CDP-glucose 4,6-dehydratase
MLCSAWGGAQYKSIEHQGPHEASFLKLDCSKSSARLSWKPKWRLETAVQQIATWYKTALTVDSARERCLEQIENYEAQ